MVQFIRGLQEKYFLNDAYLTTYKDALYFATDKGVLYLNGKDYGSEFPYKEVELVDGAKLVLTYRDEALGQKEINLIEELQKATAEQDGLMSKEYAALLDALAEMKDNDQFGKVDGVAEGDKILSVADKLISATLDLAYGKEGDVNYIYLLGKADESEGAVNGRAVVAKLDAAPFIADGMLSDAEFTTRDGVKGILFTWNVMGEDGQPKTDFVPLTELIDAYTEGNGISIVDNVISIKLDDTKTRNLLSVSATGLSLESVPTDATVLQQDIVVAGLSGTLGTGAYTNGTTIKAGTSIYTILQNILCKEQYPTGAKVSQSASLTSAFAEPSFQLTSSGSTVEVGTTVTVSALTGYAATPTTKARTYTGFTNGYSLAYGDDQDVVGSQPPAVSVTDVELVSGTYTLKREFTGFGSPTTETSSSSISADECSLEEKSLVVAEGTNTVKCTMSGPGHTGVIAASPDYYIVSNLGNTDSSKKVAAVAKSTPSIATATAGSKRLSVTGGNRYYIGYASAKPTTTAEIKKLTTFTGWVANPITKGDNSAVIGTLPAGNVMCIAVPSTYQLESITNTLGSESKGSFDTTASPAYTVKYELDDKTTVDYTVYNMESGADWEYKYIKISKK